MTIDKLTFSIIINTLDRAGPLHTLLHALEHQSYPHFEVVVVVGPVKDNTLEVLKEFEGRIRLIHCENKNLSHSRNIGLIASRGDVVAFIDDDAVPSRRWLEQYARLFEDPELDMTGGTVWAVHPKLSLLQFKLGTYSSLGEQVDVQDSPLEQIIPKGIASQWVERVMGTNMLVRRQALLEAQGFDEFYEFIAEEADLALRMVNMRKKISPVKEATVYHVPASGPNRVVFTHKGRWWIRTRSRVYLAIKNGKIAGDTLRTIATRSIISGGANIPWYLRLLRDRQLSFPDFFLMTLNELRGGLSALTHGLFMPRKLIDQKTADSAKIVTEPILMFQNDQSPLHPTVDPVSGHIPSITMPDSPLRICLLSGTYPPTQFDGVGRLTHLMAQGLFELGHTVHVVTRSDREQVSFYDGAYVHRIPNRSDRYQHYRRFYNLYSTLNYSHVVYDKVKRLILNDGIQIVDSPLWQYQGLVTLQSGITPVVVRLVTGIRQINEIHKSRVEEFTLMGDLEQSFLENAHHLMPNTQATLANIRKFYHLGQEAERSTIVSYGIIPAPEEQVRPFEIENPPDTFTVLFVGRLEKRKGILDLFEAIPLVLKQIPNVKFIIAGSDNSQSDGFKMQSGMNYPTYFANHYSKYAPAVNFLGMVSDEVLQNLYQSCDLFVAPSLYESFGLIYLEAMNYAKPVIGCNAGGIPEVVDHGATGTLVEPESPQELAEAIVSYLKSPGKLREVGLAGRQRLVQQFSYLQMARNFEQVYRKVIGAFTPELSREKTLE